MTILPLRNNVLILKDPKPDRVKGILLPEVGRQQSILGTVLAVGPGKTIQLPLTSRIEPCKLKPGDRVYLPGLGGQLFEDLDPRGPLVLIDEEFIKGRIVE